MKYFRAELPDIPCYWHGVRYPSIEMRAKSKKQVLAFLLKINNYLYLYEEYLPCSQGDSRPKGKTAQSVLASEHNPFSL